MKEYKDKKSEYFSDSRSEMLKFVPVTVKRILEIGCGKGLFGKECKRLFLCEVDGIELMEHVAIIAKEHLDKVLVGDVTENLKLIQGNKYDLIVLNDVIEHLLDSEDILVTLKQFLTGDGKILLSVPNFRNFYNLQEVVLKKDFKYKDSGILDKTHLNFYTKKSFIETVNRLNFNIVKIEGINEASSIKIHLLKPLLKLLGHGDVLFYQYAVLIAPNF